jgi:hypothetical protein
MTHEDWTEIEADAWCDYRLGCDDDAFGVVLNAALGHLLDELA